MSREKILVLGSKGQLGTALQHELKEKKIDFEAFDLPEADIRDSKQILELLKSVVPSLVINCAAYTNVEKAEDEKDLASLINAHAVGELAKVCKSLDLHLIHYSTDFVFNGKKATPYIESDSIDPLSSYGLSKAQGEKLIKESGASATVIRTQWLYSGQGNCFISKIRERFTKMDELSIVYDQIGCPTFVNDLADFTASKFAEMKSQKGFDLLHFSNEGAASWYDFAEEIRLKFFPHKKLKPVHASEFPTKAVRPAFGVLDKAKLRSKYNYEIRSWRRALDDCFSKF